MTTFVVHIHLNWGRNPLTWKANYRRRKVWDPSPYGYDNLSSHYQLTHSIDHPEGLFRKLVRRSLVAVLGWDIIHAIDNWPVISKADFVITHTEKEHLALSAIALVKGVSTPPMIRQSIWLWDDWEKYSSLRKKILRLLLQGPGIHSVHSEANLAVARVQLRSESVLKVPFGIYIDEMPELSRNVSDPIRVFAAGNDRDRDWGCLEKALSRLPDDTFARIRSGRWKARKIRSRTVDVRRASTITQILDDMQWCNVVVVPTKANLHASGLTASLEGLSVGRCIVYPDTGGLEEYLAGGGHAYRPGDAEDLAEQIVSAASCTIDAHRPAPLRKLVEERGLTDVDFAYRHRLLIETYRRRLMNSDGASHLGPVVSL